MIIYEVLVIVALVLANALFAGAEIAIVASKRIRLEQLAEKGWKGARAALKLRAVPERFFATVQVGITVVSATAGAFGGATLAEHLEPFLGSISLLAPRAEGLSIAIVVVLVSFLSIVLGELVPKSLALRYAEPYAVAVGRFLLGLSWLARPVIWIFTAISNLILRPFGDRTTFSEGRFSAEELQGLVEEAKSSGTVDIQVGEIASRALDFGQITAHDVMVPRNKIDGIPKDATPEQLRNILLERGHSRMPVYQGEINNVIGYVVTKDIIGLAWEHELIVMEDILRPAYFIPENTAVPEIVQQFKRRKTQLGIVIDEHGSVTGLLTSEDILEELVGELSSEDEAAESLIVPQENGALVRGSAPIREVNRVLGTELPEGEFSTISGLCVHIAGGVPHRGAKLAIDGGIVLEVVDASPRVVRLVHLLEAHKHG